MNGGVGRSVPGPPLHGPQVRAEPGVHPHRGWCAGTADRRSGGAADRRRGRPGRSGVRDRRPRRWWTRPRSRSFACRGWRGGGRGRDPARGKRRRECQRHLRSDHDACRGSRNRPRPNRPGPAVRRSRPGCRVARERNRHRNRWHHPDGPRGTGVTAAAGRRCRPSTFRPDWWHGQRTARARLPSSRGRSS